MKTNRETTHATAGPAFVERIGAEPAGVGLDPDERSVGDVSASGNFPIPAGGKQWGPSSRNSIPKRN